MREVNLLVNQPSKNLGSLRIRTPLKPDVLNVNNVRMHKYLLAKILKNEKYLHKLKMYFFFLIKDKNDFLK
jgi:hypothetical protein